MDDAVFEAAKRLAAIPEFTIRDDAQGLCVFCGDGWRQVPGPRGGKGELRMVDAHHASCPFDQLRRAVHEAETGE